MAVKLAKMREGAPKNKRQARETKTGKERKRKRMVPVFPSFFRWGSVQFRRSKMETMEAPPSESHHQESKTTLSPSLPSLCFLSLLAFCSVCIVSRTHALYTVSPRSPRSLYLSACAVLVQTASASFLFAASLCVFRSVKVLLLACAAWSMALASPTMLSLFLPFPLDVWYRSICSPGVVF